MRQYPFLLSYLLFLPFSHTFFAATAGDEDAQQYWLCVFKDGDSYQACAVDPRSYLNKETNTIDYSRVPSEVMSEKKVADQNPDNFYYCFLNSSKIISCRQDVVIHLAKQERKGSFESLFQKKNGWLKTHTKTKLCELIDKIDKIALPKKEIMLLLFYNEKTNEIRRGESKEETEDLIFQSLVDVKTTWEEKTESGSTKSSPLSSPPLSPVGSPRSTDSSDDSERSNPIPFLRRSIDQSEAPFDTSRPFPTSESLSFEQTLPRQQNSFFTPIEKDIYSSVKNDQPQADKSFFPITGSTMQDAGIFLLIASLLLGGSAYLLLREEKEKEGDLSYEEYLASLSEIEEGEE